MLGKLLVFLAVICAIWLVFRSIDRMGRLDNGGRRRNDRGIGARSFSERMKRAMRKKTGTRANADGEEIEETEKCLTCKAYVSVISAEDCGKKNCPFAAT